MQTLTVGLGERSYPIHIGSGLLDQANCCNRMCRASGWPS